MKNARRYIYGLLGGALLMLTLVLASAAPGAAQDHDLSPVPGAVELESSLSPALDIPEKHTRAYTTASGLTIDEASPISVFVVFEDGVDVQTLETVSDGEVVHRYREVFNGVSLVLPEDKLDAVDALDGVAAIYLDQLQQPDTEVSPQFIGAPTLWNQLGGQESAGEGTVVGILDTGIWPEHPSLSDPDPFGNPYPEPPTAPASCDFGNTAYNPNDAPFDCNNKLIGAYQFLDTYKAVIGLLPDEFDSARDDNGHGTHTASTAAGNGGVEASIFGVPRGTVSGVAPRAHVIAYRVCADQGCFQSDSVAAVEQAILDGADSINFSISGGGSPYTDIVELAFAVAYDNGVFVSASAGNSGPGPDTVAHRGPWTMTVGASTTDRHFISTVSLEADNGDTLTLTGASVTDGIDTPTPVVFPPPGEELCLEPFDPGTFNGEIVICERGIIARVEKSFNVAAGGGGGMLQYNPVLQGLATDNHFIPSVHLENDAGDALLDFMATHNGVTATFTQGIATTVQGDVMASFSSRGGAGQTLGISKPDITAPGVQILAGHTPLPATVVGGLPGELFQAIQGTSMSSPHIAGSGALLRALHPDWTPGQIKSALMLTAMADGVTKEDGVTPADPFDFGSGRVDLTKAGSAGLTMDETAANYFALQDELWNANYPSLYHPNLAGSITVKRTVINEANQPLNWRLRVMDAGDLIVDVPNQIHVPANGEMSFEITVDARNVPIGEVRHATIEFRQGNDRLHFPITIVRRQQDVSIDKTCDPLTIAIGETTDCTITITNNAFEDASVRVTDQLPQPLQLVEGSVVGATETGNGLEFEGTIGSAGAPVVDIEPSPGPAGGYLPLSLFVPPLPCPSNCDDGGFLISGLDINYLGQHYTTAILSVNGTLELGTASGIAASASNQNLPHPALPNNVLAPWWTDLDLSAGGNWYSAALTDGVTVWDVFEWTDVPRFGDASSTFTFQIWLQRGGSDNIWFVYGPFAGDTLDGTTGAENSDGTIGESYYFEGAGTLPWGGPDLGVFSVAGTPGETHTITFSARGRNVGEWTNCAEMTSPLFQETATACVSGEVIPPAQP